MSYPTLSYQTLNLKSEYFEQFLPIIKQINKIAKGGHALDPKDYLIIRDDESENIIKKRTEKFCPKNHLAIALKQQITRQQSGTLSIDLSTLPGNSDDWARFLSDCDHRGTAFKDFLLNKVFGEALINKIAYVQINAPLVGWDFNQMNLAQLEYLKDEINDTPYLSRIDPQLILSESEATSKSNLEWIKYKKILIADSPYSLTKKNLQFILIDSLYITTWTYEDVTLDENNNIIYIFDSVKDAYVKFDPTTTAEPISYPHNCSCTPVLKFQLDDLLWNCDKTFQCQKIYWGLFMNAIHTTTNAGMVQKWGKLPANNPNIPLTKYVQQEIIKSLQGNISDETMLFLDAFNFAESTGSSVEIQLKVLEDLKQYIYSTIAFNQSVIEPNQGNTPASGVSKQMDNFFQESELKSNGTKIVSFSKDVLEVVSLAFDFREPIEGILVSGMDAFSFEPTEQALGVTDKLAKLPDGLVPAPLMEESLKRVAGTMLASHSHEQRSLILNSISKSVNDFYGVSDNQDPVTTDAPFTILPDESGKGIPDVNPKALEEQHLVSDSNDAAIAIQ